jgi:hypothetical protein
LLALEVGTSEFFTMRHLDFFRVSPINEMKHQFQLQYEISDQSPVSNATGEKINYYSLNRIAEEYGYQPQFTTLELIIEELTLLSRLKKSTPEKFTNNYAK